MKVLMSEFYIDRLIGKPFSPSRVEVTHTHLYMFHFLLSSFYSQIRSKVGNILVNPTLSRFICHDKQHRWRGGSREGTGDGERQKIHIDIEEFIIKR
jgi:hypothetical protein